MPLTPAQKDALIQFAESRADLLDTLLSLDPENIAFQTDEDTADCDADRGFCHSNMVACERLRKLLKQVEAA